MNIYLCAHTLLILRLHATWRTLTLSRSLFQCARSLNAIAKSKRLEVKLQWSRWSRSHWGTQRLFDCRSLWMHCQRCRRSPHRASWHTKVSMFISKQIEAGKCMHIICIEIILLLFPLAAYNCIICFCCCLLHLLLLSKLLLLRLTVVFFSAFLFSTQNQQLLPQKHVQIECIFVCMCVCM